MKKVNVKGMKSLAEMFGAATKGKAPTTGAKGKKK